ncbi:MAG: helix-turn-helix domain-containing protein, partial [Chitinophagaceae bacterium]
MRVTPTPFIGQTRKLLKTDGITITHNLYEPEVAATWHCHDKPHFTFVLKGGCVEQRKEKSIDCIPGTLIFYNAYESHKNVNYKTRTKCLSVEFESGWLQKYHISETPLQSVSEISRHNVKTIFYSIYKESNINDSLSLLAIEGLLIQGLAVLSRQKDAENNAPAWLSKAKDYLYGHWSEPVTLQQLSKSISVHPVTLSKLFNRFFNCNFSEYKRKIKIEKSLALLHKNHITITEIAYQCGFSTPSHYIQSFKALYGITPEQYR